MPSETDIVNLALIKLGDEPIAALTDDLPRAKIMNSLYALVRDALLQAHTWNFAKERVALGRMATVPAWGYAYQYQLPTDCVQVLNLDDETAEFKVEGQKLLTDNSTAKILYIKQITDTTEFSAMFIDTFSSRLAAEASQVLPGKSVLVQQLWTLYDRKLHEAKMYDIAQGTPEVAPLTILESVR